MSCCSQGYKYKSLKLAVVVSDSDMARVRGKMCVTCRSPTTRTASILIITPTSQRPDHRWASYSLSRLLACWAPSDPHVLPDLHSVSHPPRVCTSSCWALFPSDLCYFETIASMFIKSCNCNSSIATRIGFAVRSQLQCPVPIFLISWQMIFALNSMLAWLMKTRFMIEHIEKWSYDYIKMDCEEGKCYGVLAVSVFFHEVFPLAPSRIGSPCLLRPRNIPCYSQYLTHRRTGHPRQEGSHSKWVRVVIFSLHCLLTQF
jgi:hypothetical protein